MAEAQLHGALQVLMVEVVVEEEDQSNASVVEGHTMLMRARIGNNDDFITLDFHLVGVTTFITTTTAFSLI